ncbi:MAG: type IX secretion system sortase PorU [Tannerellaceae bacterium]|jgi:hypothetical protein|nr:type IX secretion system sortase PorU [Tannerellaceae bacterium]
MTTLWADGNRYASGSVFASGKWIKIKVDTTGIYKLTAAELQKMGFSDISKVSVHGYGGWPLDEDFRKPYIDDAPAVAIRKTADYLLFYAKGPVKWEYDKQGNTFVHTNNPYSTSGYYFITDSSEAKEMETVASFSGASLTISTFDDYWLYEKEEESVNQSGREFFGDFFNGNLPKTFFPLIPGITGDDGKVSMRFIARPKTTAGRATLSMNDRPLLNLSFGTVSDIYEKARSGFGTADWTGEKSGEIKISVVYNNMGDENVRLDYIRLQMKRTLRLYGDYTFFRSLSSIGNASRFILQGADAYTEVYDVTDGVNPKRMEAQLNGSELSFTIPAGELREFVAVNTARSLSSVGEAKEVKNQNLHALPQTDMIIISPNALRSQAERLAEAHRKRDGLSVEVVNPQDIYNEFSSGAPDATAYRRFMKMFYDRGLPDGTVPRYLLLFGDGSYDNRGVSPAWRNIDMSGMLLTYQSENSLNYDSYVTDDYFGALQDSPFEASAKLQIGIGRFPVRTIDEAQTTVDKVLSYMDNTLTGEWKNNITFVADDGSSSDGFTIRHMDQANRIVDSLRKNHPEFLVKKLFFDSYKKDNSGGGGSYPDVKRDIQRQLREGLLMINYIGHGGMEAWSDEKVLTQTEIAGFSYKYLPLWITATCDFTRFDYTSTTAGEEVFLKKSGGIALFTTTRIVDSYRNFDLNRELFNHLFEKDKNGLRLTLGDIIKYTKNGLTDNNKLNFILIGDPALKLAYPEYGVRITAINGQPTHADTVTFKAQERITIRGEVLQPDNSMASGFSGSLHVTVLDSKQTIETLNNNRTDVTLTYTDYPNTLFTGNDIVTDGSFEFSFYVPKDISYSNDFGIMNLYAADPASGHEAQGSYQNFRVGGSAANPEEDSEGPEIRRLYLNDTTFVDGGKVNPTPFFVVRLWDKTGVNITGNSIGHDIVLTIDNQPSLRYTLNTYYQSIPGSNGEGFVRFLLPVLPAGSHTAEFKAWDILNNPTRHTFHFEVEEGLKPSIAEIVASPVPARENVQFRIYHNRPESDLTVGVKVYDLTGRVVWSSQESGSSEFSAPYTVTWDLKSSGGARLRPGVYIYRAVISTRNSKEASGSRKLIILAQ